MIFKKIFSFLALIITGILLSHCNDSPTDLGSNFLNQDGVEVKKFDSMVDSISQNSFDFKKVYILGNASHVLLGKTENVTSHILLKFAFLLPDSIVSEIKSQTINVIDSYVTLTKDYSFGNSNGSFDYKVFKINEFWSSSDFTSDDFASLSVDNVDLSSNRTSLNDTTYTFHLSNELATSWLKNYADTSLGNNYGILLSPEDNTQKVLGFTAYNVSDVNVPILRVVVQKPGAYIDTLIGYITLDVSAIIGSVADVGTENLAIQSSLTSEMQLNFDFSVLPKDIAINSAKLTLTIDTLQSKFGSDFENSLSVFLIADSTKDSLNKNYSYKLSRNGNTFSGDITYIIRAFNNNVDNQGILIKSTQEFWGLEIFAIKGSNASNISDRPRLEIIYSKGGKR
ncbi:MAG: hypothetical protein ROY99_11610 [Ignavibacterium sp.]|nr:hypothetical protein [Ignavibacterium sp.]